MDSRRQTELNVPIRLPDGSLTGPDDIASVPESSTQLANTHPRSVMIRVRRLLLPCATPRRAAAPRKILIVPGSGAAMISAFPTPGLTSMLYRSAPGKLGSMNRKGSADALADVAATLSPVEA